jgi:hypothetical protein
MTDTCFWTDPKMQTILLRYSVDFHDWQHRPTCFKRGCECRFNLPEMSWPGTSLEIEAELDDESNVTTWYRLNTDPMKSTNKEANGLSIHEHT